MADEKDIFSVIKEIKDNPDKAAQYAGTQPPAAPAGDNPPPPPTPTAPEPFDESKWLTDKFQGKYKTFDDLQAELSKAPVIEYKQPEYPTETSRQIADLLGAGKELEVYPILQKKYFASQLPTLSEEDKLIARIRDEYPSLTHAQAKREFDKRYVPDTTGLSDVDIELETAKAKDKRDRDAQEATQYFTKIAEEIKFPTVQQQAAPQPQLTDQQKEILVSGQKFTADKVSSLPFEFQSPEKNITVKGTIPLPVDKVAEIKKQMAADPATFLAGFILSRYYTPEGKVNEDAVARDITFLDDPATWANDIAKQSMEQTYTERLKQERNYRDPNQTGRNAFDTGDEAVKKTIYKGLRIPEEKPNGVHAPTA